MNLSEVEIRILGSLVEKSLTTPEYYPMSPNAIMNACNQKSSRDPVVSYDETVVVRALFSLRDKGLVVERGETGSRVTKFAHRFDTIGVFTAAQVAALCLLMLRGPQTAGEIRTHSGRMFEFESPLDAEEALNRLMGMHPPFVAKLPRQTGHKEQRFAHLFRGEPSATPTLGIPTVSAPKNPPPTAETVEQVSPLEQRVAELEARVAELTQTVADLKAKN